MLNVSEATMVYCSVNALGLPTCEILDLTSMENKAVAWLKGHYHSFKTAFVMKGGR